MAQPVQLPLPRFARVLLQLSIQFMVHLVKIRNLTKIFSELLLPVIRFKYFMGQTKYLLLFQVLTVVKQEFHQLYPHLEHFVLKL